MAGELVASATTFAGMTEKVYDLLIITSALALVPMLVAIGTSFAKIAIVLSLIRNALGVQQIPPNMTLYGIALILTLYIMKPVVSDIYVRQDQYTKMNENTPPDEDKVRRITQAIEYIGKPLNDFLEKNTRKKELDFFIATTQELWPKETKAEARRKDPLILIPAFAVSEITRAFEIGFLIYLPFVIIDLVVSNILLTLGMMMVSPMTISLPFKLLLFVMIDGWSRLIHGLVLSYK